MPTSPLPPDRTKVSYILLKTHKADLERAAKRAGVTMSTLITETLTEKGVIAKARPRAEKSRGKARPAKVA